MPDLATVRYPRQVCLSIVVISSRGDLQDLLILATTGDQVVHELLEKVTRREWLILGKVVLSIPTLTWLTRSRSHRSRGLQ